MTGQIKSVGAASAAGEVGRAPGQLPCLGGGLENLQATCLSLPTPRKPSSNLFWPFRCVGNLQTTCFGLSDASETFKQLVSAFPSPRKPSSNLFEPSDPSGRQGRLPSLPGTNFFGYPASFPAPAGAVRDVCQVCRVRVFWGTRPASLPRQGPSGTSAKFAGYGFFEVFGQLPSLGRGRQGRLPSLPGTGFLRYPASFPAPAGAAPLSACNRPSRRES